MLLLLPNNPVLLLLAAVLLFAPNKPVLLLLAVVLLPNIPVVYYYVCYPPKIPPVAYYPNPV